MSWQKSAQKLITEFGEDAVDWLRRALPDASTLKEAREALTGRAPAKPARSLAARPAPKANRPLAVKPTPKALPAPQKPLALPAPGPRRPDFAVKSRGGQWWPDIDISEQYSAPRNYSPEYAVRRAINNQFVGQLDPSEQALRDWFEKAATRYIKTDLGTPEDPLRDLAEQGNLHLADTTPDQWSRRAALNIYAEPVGYYTVPPSAPTQTEAGLIDLNFGPEQSEVDQLLGAAPWLRKAPVTDPLHGLSQDINNQLGFHHLLDEMGNAMNPQSGLPPELQLDPGSLQRMGMAQASERVGRINQWRAEQAANAALQARDNPATHTFREYAENNPLGLRWVELRAPETPENFVPEEHGWVRDTSVPDLSVYDNPTLNVSGQLSPEKVYTRQQLQDALRYEGDTMGHCVGGYCDDVLEGRSRIFSLRDAKGEPHVTVETMPGRGITALAEIPADIVDQLSAAAKADTDEVALRAGVEPFSPAWNRTYNTNLTLKQREWVRDNPAPEDIVQIKGKQNRAPKDDYLPFVQDFVKSGQWGNVGDLGNTGLVKLPDGRYITQQQLSDVVSGMADRPFSVSGNWDRPDYWDTADWEAIRPQFEGYAIGGRVSADRCFCRHPMSAKG